MRFTAAVILKQRVTLLAAVALLIVATLGAGDSALGESVERCDRDAIVLPAAAADARGTTFTGRYRGDNMGTDTAHGLATYWSVDRVYAGRPLPSDLTFDTPPCAWTNLTPGVRYLFSTAATDIAIDVETGSADRGMPRITDSLAWAIGPDDTVSLAAFDTYAAEDYSADLRSITSLAAALEAMAPGSGEGEAPGPPTEQGGAGCTGYFEPPTTAQAQGTTFVGRYIGDERLPASPTHRLRDVRAYWAVERVYAGAPLPEVLTMRTYTCDPLTLTLGRRYLFSSADITSPGPWDSLAWRLRKGGAVTLATFGDATGWVPDVRAIKTFEEALEAVAPGAGDGEPPLRSGDRTPG